MKITETRYITMEKIRTMCIDEDWCDMMIVAEYDALMMKYSGMNMRAIDIHQMALKIANKSSKCDVNNKDCIENIMYIIAKNCYTCFDIEEDEDND